MCVCSFKASINSWICGDSSSLSGFVVVMAVAPGWKWKVDHWREGSREGILVLTIRIEGVEVYGKVYIQRRKDK